MKRIVLFFLSVILTLTIFSLPASADDHVVLTIADTTERSGNRYDENLGMWQYLAEKLGVEIRYLYLTPQEYAAALSSGDLPDIVATTNNLSAILENDAALDAGPYLEEYAPNFLKGEIGLTVDVYRQLAGEEGGFYFFPARIGYNGVGYDNTTSSRGYVVRWDYYKELGYPPINNEDDYLKVLLQMHENHPFTEDGHPTYLYGTDNFSAYDTAFRSELNLDYWVAYKYQNNIFTNQIYDGYTDTAHSMWWAAMEWENKVYRAGKDDGSYDMDLFTQDLKQFEAKVRPGPVYGTPQRQIQPLQRQSKRRSGHPGRLRFRPHCRNELLHQCLSASGQRTRIYVVHFPEQSPLEGGPGPLQLHGRSGFRAGADSGKTGGDLGLR